MKDWVAFYHHGCRDDGAPPCMNMLRSHALPIPVFRVKTIQPSLNLRWFGHVRVIVCKCCGLSMAVPMANSPTPSLQHNYSNHCTATQYQCNITYNLHLIEDCIVHGAPLFSLANRSMQNPKHDCVANINEKVRAVALRLSQTASVTPECNETTPEC